MRLHSVKLEPTALTLVGTRFTYYTIGDAEQYVLVYQ